MKTTEIHTDGACSGNPGPGGWAAIVIDADGRRDFSGGESTTTNNRMELTAAIEGLEATPQGSRVKVHSDSQYLVNTMTRGWKRKANHDLWGRLDRLVGDRAVTWEWVRGHSGDPLNEEADSLAYRESQTRAGRAPGEHPALRDSESPAPYSAASLSHVDPAGRASMVDVGDKPETARTAVAAGQVSMTAETLRLIQNNGMGKGDVLAVARVAGIMAAKRTPELIPLCHTLPLDSVKVEFRIDEEGGRVQIRATASTTARTGVEMEALTAVSAAALTIYDMCKSVDRAMVIGDLRLLKKTGGRTGTYLRSE